MNKLVKVADEVEALLGNVGIVFTKRLVDQGDGNSILVIYYEENVMKMAYLGFVGLDVKRSVVWTATINEEMAVTHTTVAD